MDCATATEQLPWLLNGSLDPGERRELEAHLAGCDACRAELGATAASWDLMAAHPPPALLAAWAEGEDLPDAELLADHVAGCSACAEEVELVREAVTLEAFTPLPGRFAGGDGGRWRRIAVAAVLVAGVSLTALLSSWITGGRRARLAEIERDQSRVAAAEARLDTLSAEIARIGRRATELAAPLANVPVLELLPDSFTLRGGSEPLTVHSGAGAAALILATRTEPGWDGYRLRVVAADGGEVWRADDLIRNSTGDFTVLLPFASLPRGELGLAVDGRRGGDWTELEVFRLVISD